MTAAAVWISAVERPFTRIISGFFCKTAEKSSALCQITDGDEDGWRQDAVPDDGKTITLRY